MFSPLRRSSLSAILIFQTAGRASTFSTSQTLAKTGHTQPEMTSLPASSKKVEIEESKRTLRVLALHGSEGTAAEFPSRLDSIESILRSNYDTRLEITAIQGPFAKGKGFSWWTMEEGARSFTASSYEGFQESSQKVLDKWALGSEDSEDDRFDLILGHSQGAIMIASLLALDMVPYYPKVGYIFNGVSFPNPFRKEVLSLASSSAPSTRQRILFVMGTNDKITPNETGLELMHAFEAAGMDVDIEKHAGGHAIPKGREDAVEKVAKWIAQA